MASSDLSPRDAPAPARNGAQPEAIADLPRPLVLEGASNVRDLGGWPTADGRRVVFGKLFRSAALAQLTDADRVSLASVGLRTVCDLRGRRERERAPSRLDGLEGVKIHPLPIEPSVGGSLTEILATREATGEDVLALLRRAYLAYAFGWANRYRTIFELILDDQDRLPLLIHCSAGKDRTGFAAALILSALDVPWTCIMADYLATRRLWRSDPEMARELPPAVADKLLGVHAELLDETFAAIRREFASMDRYFGTVLGLDGARRQRLGELLLA